MFDELERRVAEKEAIRENSARLASSYARYSSDGQGTVEFGRRANFGLTFIERPFVSYCSVLDLDELGDLMDIAGGEPVPMPSRRSVARPARPRLPARRLRR